MTTRAPKEVVCARQRSSLSLRDRQRHHRIRFEVPEGASRLEILFRYGPAAIGRVRNLLTLTLHDPVGFRGAAHRWQPEQEILLEQAHATPGFFPAPVYAGDWECSVDVHELVTRTCEVELTVHARVEGPRVQPSAGDPRAIPSGAADLGGPAGWFQGDLHSHNLHCDGVSGVGEMSAAAARRGLDFLAMTCHNTTSWLSSTDGWPNALLTVRGMELTTFFGHATVLGLRDWIDWRVPGHGFGIRRIQEDVRARGAVFVVAHPFAVGNPHCTGCQWVHLGLDLTQLDCVEVWNGRWGNWEVDNEAALDFWTELLERGLRVTAVAGSDSHSATDYESAALPVTWVHAARLSEAGVLDALRRGHVILSSGPKLRLGAGSPDRREELLPGAVVPAEHWGRLFVDVADLAVTASLWLVSDGVAAGQWDVEPPGGELLIEVSCPRRWSRLELRRGRERAGELLAMTNPLYAVGGKSRWPRSRLTS